MRAGYDVNNSRARIIGATALKAAVETADVTLVRYVLAHGADTRDPGAFVEAYKQGGQIFDVLLQEHNHRFPKGCSGWGTCILSGAIESDDLGLFNKLLDGGADANQFFGTTTPLGYAIHQHKANGHKFVEYLLQRQQQTACTPETIVSFTSGASASSSVFGRTAPRVQVTAFLAAIGTRNLPMMEIMLRYHADVNYPAVYGVKRTPLQRATELGSMEMIKWLLDKGADVNGAAALRGGGTALQFAAMEGYIPIARLLLENGADVDAPASKVHGRTALEGAAWAGRLDMVTVLLKAGAAHRGADQRQIAKAIAFAEENSHTHIFELLDHYRQTKTLSSAQPSYEEVFNWAINEPE